MLRRIEYANPTHPCVDRMGDDFIKNSKIKIHVHNTTRSWTSRDFSEHPLEGGFPHPQIHTEGFRPVEIGSPVIVAILFLDGQDIHTTPQHVAGIVKYALFPSAVHEYRSVKRGKTPVQYLPRLHSIQSFPARQRKTPQSPPPRQAGRWPRLQNHQSRGKSPK